MNPIITERLQIIPLTLELLELCLEGRECMEKSLGLEQTITLEELPQHLKQALESMILNVKQNPEDWFWYTNWEIVMTKENRIIGGIAFYGRPQNEEVEIAYVIQENYRRQMFATEAVSALADFAFDTVKSVKAVTEKFNQASIRMLENLNFVLNSEDEEGNLVFVKSSSR